MLWRCDLSKQAERHMDALLAATREVLSTGRYVLGAQLEAFERAFAHHAGAAHCVGLANGTDALILGLRALGVEAGDEVVTTPFTAIPTISAIRALGARPVFADIDPGSFLMDIDQAANNVTSRTKAVMPVHLFAQMVDVEALREKLPEGVPILEDAAQAHGCRLRGVQAGATGNLTAFSFYPSKNLGGYGDGGCLVTDDAVLAQSLRLMRNYGKQGSDDIIRNGYNSRLDELQAAFLAIKLPFLEEDNARRRDLAEGYAAALDGLPVTPQVIAVGCLPNYHIYTVRIHGKRDQLRDYLAEKGIQTDVFYPQPHHLQPALKDLGYTTGDFPHAEEVGRHILALPLYPEMDESDFQLVCDTIRAFFNRRKAS